MGKRKQSGHPEDEEPVVTDYMAQQFDVDGETLLKSVTSGARPIETVSLDDPPKCSPPAVHKTLISHYNNSSTRSLIDSYRDVIVTTGEDAYQSTMTDMRRSVALHAANHVLRCKSLVARHNKALKDDPDAIPGRDQGFTKGRVLLALPTCGVARAMLDNIIAVLGGKLSEDLDLDDVFGPAPDTEDPEPADRHTFDMRGDTSDQFLFGISIFTRGGNHSVDLKMPTEARGVGSDEFVASLKTADIIIASSLQLKILAETGRSGHTDCLSSIEILYLDAAHYHYHQNWDNVKAAIGAVNQMAAKTEGVDFDRLRPVYSLFMPTADDDDEPEPVGAGVVRQTIVTSLARFPELNAFTKKLTNHAGVIKYAGVDKVAPLEGVVVKTTHNFHRIPTESRLTQFDDKIAYLKSKILPVIRQGSPKTLIVCSTYFDYVRVESLLKEELSKAQWVKISEYTNDKKRRARKQAFNSGDGMVMLYSERSHFFRRVSFRGADLLVFFSPPMTSSIYRDLVNNNSKPKPRNATVMTLWTDYDTLGLSGVVGRERAGRMARGGGEGVARHTMKTSG